MPMIKENDVYSQCDIGKVQGLCCDINQTHPTKRLTDAVCSIL